jgi:hypothetical protein
MSGPAISGDALGKPTFRMPRFHYTGAAKVLMTVDVDLYAEVLVVGDPDNGAYGWVIVNHGDVEDHSDCGYGQKSIALQDGLIAYHGLTPLQDAAPELLEALSVLKSAVDALVSEKSAFIPFSNANSIGLAMGKASAAIAKAGS